MCGRRKRYGHAMRREEEDEDEVRNVLRRGGGIREEEDRTTENKMEGSPNGKRCGQG